MWTRRWGEDCNEAWWVDVAKCFFFSLWCWHVIGGSQKSENFIEITISMSNVRTSFSIKPNSWAMAFVRMWILSSALVPIREFTKHIHEIIINIRWVTMSHQVIAPWWWTLKKVAKTFTWCSSLSICTLVQLNELCLCMFLLPMHSDIFRMWFTISFFAGVQYLHNLTASASRFFASSHKCKQNSLLLLYLCQDVRQHLYLFCRRLSKSYFKLYLVAVVSCWQSHCRCVCMLFLV